MEIRLQMENLCPLFEVGCANNNEEESALLPATTKESTDGRSSVPAGLLYGASLVLLLLAVFPQIPLKGQGNAKPTQATLEPKAAAPAQESKGGLSAAAPTGTVENSPTLCRGESDTNTPPAGSGLMEGLIGVPDSKGIVGTSLAVIGQETPNRIIVEKFTRCPGDAGRLFYSTALPPGSYQATLSNPGLSSDSTSVAIKSGEVRRVDFRLGAPGLSTTPLLFLVPFAFLISIWLIRWNNIAVPSRRGLLASVVDTRSRLNTSGSSPRGVPPVELDSLETDLKKRNIWDWLFWSRGLEIAGWMLVHKAEIALLQAASSERVDARLRSAEQQLADINTAASNGLASRIKIAFDTNTTSPADRKQLLVEALSFLYDRSDTDFATLTSWQNKAFWLTLVGVLFIVSISITDQHANLFLAGAAGGFLSRMMRQIKRADVPTDYGASWATLFLSPVAGALAGWFGVVIIMLLADPKVGILAGPLKAIDWNLANMAPVLGTAFALGFSERLFDGLMTQLDESIDQKKQAAQATKTVTATIAPTTAPPTANPPVVDLDHVSPGQTVTVSLTGSDLSQVKSVDLANSATKQEHTTQTFSVSQDKLTFTVSADTNPGVYNLLLVTASDRVDTKKQLTVIRQ